MRGFLWSAAIAGLLLSRIMAPASGTKAEPTRWRPEVVTSWQIQINGNPDISRAADAYDVDLVETPPAKIASLKERGTAVICYFSAGSYEKWRPDAGDLPKEVRGRALDGWPGERWLDIRHSAVRTVMEARLDFAVEKGCDAVDPDNVDGYLNRSGFPLSGGDQIAYNQFLASAAHERGLAVGLKNDVE